MHITLVPQAFKDERTLEVIRTGEVLSLNGESFDFSGLPDGATIPEGHVPSPWILGPVERVDGSLRINLLLPLGHAPSHEQCYPSPIIDPDDGLVELPRASTPEPMFMPEAVEDEEPTNVDA